MNTGNIFRDVLNRDRVLNRKPMTLSLQPRLVDKDSRICVEPGERETDVGVYEGDFRGCDAGVLEFHCRALFAAEDDDRGTFYADGAGAAFHCFEGVFDLEDMAVGREDWCLLVGGLDGGSLKWVGYD